MGRRGYANIEILLVMLLLCAVTFLIFSTVAAGSKAYDNLAENQSRDAELRVGLSFLDVRLKKSDIEGGVRIRDNPFADGKALCIRSTIETRPFDTWIYCLDGGLYELFLPADARPAADTASLIARADRMDIVSEGGGILRIALSLDSGSDSAEPAGLSGTFYLKTGVS